MRQVLLLFCLIVISGFSCKKATDWLNTPKFKKDITIETLKDYQLLLNNTSILNLTMPIISQIGGDNIYVNERSVPILPVIDRNAYLWNKDIFEGRISLDYSFSYQAINYVNVVLEGIETIEVNSGNFSEYNSIKGQASFFRSIFYFELASIFCKQYNQTTAGVDKGLCLRVNSDVNGIVQRSSALETYKLILSDAHKAVELLSNTKTVKTQPSKTAALILLARVYLNMADYENARKYADAALNISSDLIDFTSVPDLALPFRFPDFKKENAELIFYAQGNLYQTVYPSELITSGLVDTMLYRSYNQNDLRKIYFYKEFDSVTIKFKGSYTGVASNFAGLTTSEAFYIRAECNARLNDLSSAIRDLNIVLRSRYKTGTYIDFDSNDSFEVLQKVLQERRKEFPFTGNIRWQDLRRNNLDPRLATIIRRKIAGEVKVLPPNDPKYVYPFPQSEIQLAGLEQNER